MQDGLVVDILFQSKLEVNLICDDLILHVELVLKLLITHSFEGFEGL